MRYKLGKIFNLQMGKTPDRHSPKFWNEGTEPWISIADLTKCNKYIENTAEKITATAVDESGIKIIPKNTVIMSFKLSIGKVAITPKEMYSNEAIMSFIDKGVLKIEPVYLYYLLMHKDWDTGTNKAVMGKTLNKATLSQMTVNIHGYSEQLEIIKALDAASSIIAARKQQLTELDNLIKARFVEMFVATDAASDWPYCTIADVSNDMRTGPFGSALHHDEFVDSGVFVLGIDNAVENKFSYNRMRYITAEKYQELKRYTVYPGDVIITIMGTVGRSAVIPADMPKAINTKHLACITPNAKMVNAQFLSCAFQVHPDIRAQLQKQCKGAIMDGLNLTIIKGLSFHIPPINLQDRFVGFYEQVDKSKVAVQKALDEAQLLFDSLMQKYFG